MRWGNLKVMPSEVGEDEVGEYCAPFVRCLKLPVWPRGRGSSGSLRVKARSWSLEPAACDENPIPTCSFLKWYLLPSSLLPSTRSKQAISWLMLWLRGRQPHCFLAAAP